MAFLKKGLKSYVTAWIALSMENQPIEYNYG